MPHPPHSTYLAPNDFFYLLPWMKEVLRGKHFATVKEVKQKMAEVLRCIKINKFKTVVNSGKNVSMGVLHQMESTFKVTEV